MRAELRGLPPHLALAVGAHLVAAGGLIDDDPELAYAHAEAARRRAARLPIVREATAEAAYAAGHYAVALNEFRALRRMTGGTEYIPVMADCERALGRPEAALRLVDEARRAPGFPEDPAQATELLLVEAGARSDRGQQAEALRLLKAGINHDAGSPLSRARLRYAYADMLLATGDESAAREWFTAAASLDAEGELDAEDRLAQLDGVYIELDLDDEDEMDDDEDVPADDDSQDADDDREDADEPDQGDEGDDVADETGHFDETGHTDAAGHADEAGDADVSEPAPTDQQVTAPADSTIPDESQQDDTNLDTPTPVNPTQDDVEAEGR